MRCVWRAGVMAALVVVASAVPAGAETFNGDGLNFNAIATHSGARSWRADLMLGSLDRGLRSASFGVVRGVEVRVPAAPHARTVGALRVGAATYALRVPARRSGAVTVLRRGALRVVLRPASSSPGERAFLVVSGLSGSATGLRVDLRPGVLRVVDTRCLRIEARVARTGVPPARIRSGQGAGCSA